MTEFSNVTLRYAELHWNEQTWHAILLSATVLLGVTYFVRKVLNNPWQYRGPEKNVLLALALGYSFDRKVFIAVNHPIHELHRGPCRSMVELILDS